MGIQTSAIIGAAAIAIGFGGGWQVNGWRLNSKMAKMQVDTIKVYEERQKVLNQEFAEQIERDTTARMALSQRLQQTRTKAAGMERELETLRLSPTSPRIETVLVPGDCDAGQKEVVVANPFSDDFVRLWNSSATGAIAGEAPTP